MGERLNSVSLEKSCSEVSNTTIWKVILTLIFFEKNSVNFHSGMLELPGAFGETF